MRDLYHRSLSRQFSFLIIAVLGTLVGPGLNVATTTHQANPYSIDSQNAEKGTPNLVSVELVVRKKSDGRIVPHLKQSNFAVFLDGVRKEITGFADHNRPLEAVLLVEYSFLGAPLSEQRSLGFGEASLSVVQPAGELLAQLIQQTSDRASVVAFDIRPTTMTDLTNEPSLINEAVKLLIQNRPAFRESALFDSLNFVLLGGLGQTAVLQFDKSKKPESNYSGLAAVRGKRKAITLISSGLDTSSKIDLKKVRKTLQNAGVPIFVIGTAEMFTAQQGNRLPTTDIDQLKRAEVMLKAIAHETGGAFFSFGAKTDGPDIFSQIGAMVRGQYNLTFNPDETPDGKAHTIVVKIDSDDDGVYDEQTFEVLARQVYNAPKN